MVTLILVFIFRHAAPVGLRRQAFGDAPGPPHPMMVSSDGGQGVIITVQAADVVVPAGASDTQVKSALRAGD